MYMDFEIADAMNKQIQYYSNSQGHKDTTKDHLMQYMDFFFENMILRTRGTDNENGILVTDTQGIIKDDKIVLISPIKGIVFKGIEHRGKAELKNLKIDLKDIVHEETRFSLFHGNRNIEYRISHSYPERFDFILSRF
jgi:hypothetical protein